MPEAGLAGGERRALFRLLAPDSGGHHYATLREGGTGPERFTLEVRRGLVWGFTQQVLVVRAGTREGGGLALSVAGGSGPDERAGHVDRDDLADFATAALQIAAERLGVGAGAFYAASHVDLGESGTLGVETPVRQRSGELLDRMARTRTASEPAQPGPAPASVPEDAAPASPARASGGSASESAAAETSPADASAPGVRRADAPQPDTPAPRDVAPSTASTPPPQEARDPGLRTAPASSAPSTDRPASRPPAPGEGSPAPTGLLSRIVGWLRRAARAALGR